jgi:hypothetical protein
MRPGGSGNEDRGVDGHCKRTFRWTGAGYCTAGYSEAKGVMLLRELLERARAVSVRGVRHIIVQGNAQEEVINELDNIASGVRFTT